MNFEINASGIERNTVSITDFDMVAAKVARVVLAFTGNLDKDEITAALSAKLKHMATPIENSFRMVKANVAVGYIRANTPVRVVEDNEIRASYKVIAKNILMDRDDETLWEVKTGASGKFLARSGSEDLSDLVAAGTTRRHDVPRLAQMSIASVAKREFVAFASKSGDMDYGFCVGVAADRIKVVSASTQEVEIIPIETVASVIPVGGAKIPRETHNRIVKAGISREDANQEIEYYRRLYSYDQAYLNEVIRQVEGTASL
jgi:hypothetical protein